MKKVAFESLKNASLAHGLIKAGRFVNERGLRNAQNMFNLPNLRQSHLDLFPHIDFDGNSISEIAERRNVSKQAVSQLVQEMIEMQLLQIKLNPKDSRSKIVLFKTKGPFSIYKGFKALSAIDIQLKELLGDSQYSSLLKGLLKIEKTFDRK